MAEIVKCPNGHQWDSSADATEASFGGPLVCPECGAAAAVGQPEGPTSSLPAPLPPPMGLQGSLPTFDQPASVDGDTINVPVPTQQFHRGTPQVRITIPGYEILSELGRGGMGVVYKARQKGLNRLVALKMILSGDHAAAKERARFRAEAQAVARLQHPNIVQIYEVGETEGRPFFSLEYVEGGSLAGRLDGTPWNSRPAAQLVESLAPAVHAAHQQKIVHRDLKPHNVLLGGDGTPKISDFGLAKRLDASTGPTQSGAILGTPSYMAPEQAAGKLHLIGPATDVYALGAILYELLTGRPPFRAQTSWDTIRQVLTEEVVPPSRLQSQVPHDLETICLKCLHKEPAQRYPTAQALGADLRRFLDGLPIHARPAGALLRWTKWLRRRPAEAAALVVIFLTLSAAVAASLSDNPVAALTTLIIPITALGMGGILWQWRRAQSLKKHAEQQREQVEAARQEAEEAARKTAEALADAESNLYLLQITLADREVQAAHIVRAEELLGACPRRNRHWEWHYLKRLCRPELMTLEGHERPVLQVAVHPGGRELASGGWDQVIRLWNLETGAPVATLTGHSGQVTSLAYRCDGRYLASAGGDRRIIIWDVEHRRKINVLTGHQHSVLGVAFSPDGQLLASGGGDQVIRIWNLKSGKEQLTLRGHGREVTGVAFSPDGRFVASSSADQCIRIYEVQTGRGVNAVTGNGAIFAVAYHPDGTRLASAVEDGTVRITDIATARELLACRGHTGPVRSVAFHPQGHCLASASWDKTIKFWDTITGKELGTLRSHAGKVTTLAFSGDGGRLVSGSDDRTVKVWDTVSAAEARFLRGHDNSVLCLAFSPDGRRLVSGSGRILGRAPGEIRLWEVAAGQSLWFHAVEGCGVRSVAFSPKGNHFASAHEDGKLCVWDAARGDLLFKHHAHSGMLGGIGFSSDGHFLVSAGDDGTAMIWHASTGDLFRTIRPGIPVGSLAFHPGGRRLALASKDRLTGVSDVRIWDVMTGEEVLTLAQTPGAALSLAFSAAGDVLVGGLHNGAVRVWDATDGQAIATLHGHTAEVAAVAFSADDHRLLSASHDQTVKLWEVSSGQELLTLRGFTGEFTSVAFSPDGQRIAAGCADHALRIWEASPPQVIARGGPPRPGSSMFRTRSSGDLRLVQTEFAVPDR